MLSCSYMGTFQKSWALAKESYNILKAQPQLAFFPIISAVASIAVAISFAVPLFLSGALSSLEHLQPIHYVLLFLFYCVSSFVVVFFNAGLVSCAYDCLNGRPTDYRTGLRNAGRHLGAILLWSIISATVGVILRYIGERSGIVGRIVIALLGAAWSLLIYFVVPIMVLEDKTPVTALKESSLMLKKSWGERVVAGLGMGAVTGVLMLIGLIPVAVGVALISAGLWPIAIVAGALAVLYFLFAAVVCTTLGGIFNTALYVYASSGQIPQGFSEDYLKGAFREKKKMFFTR